jgi:muramoyltetrapeptide carboxypeptidase
MKNPPDGPYIQTIEDGTAEGEITGGNLDLIVATLSTEYEIETKEKIFFFEAAGHRTWELDRILVHLELSGKLGEAAGFVAGQMLLCDPVDRAMMELMPYLVRMDPKEVMDHQFSSTVEEVLQERLSRFRVPAIYGLCCGHTEDQSVIPIGVRATLDGTEGLRIVESAVTT